MSGFVVPPGGLQGFNQMTPASQRALFPRGKGNGNGGKRRRRKAAKKASAPRRKASSGRKMKFGSPAWQKKYKVGKFAKKK